MVDINKERFRVTGIQSQTTNESENSVEIVVNPLNDWVIASEI